MIFFLKDIASLNKLDGTPRNIHVTDLTGDGEDNILVTCYKTLAILNGGLHSIVSKEFKHSIKSICAADLDGDGSEEILVGGRENWLHILKLRKNCNRSLFKARKAVSEKFDSPIAWGVYSLNGNPFKS